MSGELFACGVDGCNDAVSETVLVEGTFHRTCNLGPELLTAFFEDRMVSVYGEGAGFRGDENQDAIALYSFVHAQA